METYRANDYGKLQNQIDLVIGKIGLKNTLFLLEGVLDSSGIPVTENQQFQLISQYLITECIKVFELKEQLFFTSSIQEYREARMISFHLLKKYSEASYAKIGENLGLTKRTVLYNHNKCAERLSVPFYYKVFVNKYETLEKCLLLFISKLNAKPQS